MKRWKIVEAEDGQLTSRDLVFISIMLAQRVRELGSLARREAEIWEKIQDVVEVAMEDEGGT